MSNRIPIREGIFTENNGAGRLIGNKCASCGQIYFPKADFCFSCLSKVMEEVPLSRRGKLYSYTIGRLPSTRFSPPYFVGMVDLPEGVRIFAPLKVTDGQTVGIGMDMEVVIEALFEENDKYVIGYKFKPLSVPGD